MRISTLIHFIFIACTLFIISCVNVSLPESTHKATNVNFVEPKKPFVQIFPHEIDGAWRHAPTGTTISYFTECKNPTNPSIENIIKGAVSALSDPILSPIKEYNMGEDRPAKTVQATGMVGKVKSKIEVVVAKYEDCIYLLSLVSTENNFPKYKSILTSLNQDLK